MAIIRLLQIAPAPVTAVGLLGGFGLIMTGIPILAAVGTVFIIGGLLVPFLVLTPQMEPEEQSDSVDIPGKATSPEAKGRNPRRRPISDSGPTGRKLSRRSIPTAAAVAILTKRNQDALKRGRHAVVWIATDDPLEDGLEAEVETIVNGQRKRVSGRLFYSPPPEASDSALEGSDEATERFQPES